ncbi:MAG: hypothetical protein AUH85_05550 [Chloroflexi bacterium 13_1_40CM_4_68_4]|nr:MAG: hypothetical protein AUH85_05550 [Chloroflexi bacterium 13_1_40CM_4_68_4]
MRYEMNCPAPGCRDIYRVEATTDTDAVEKLLKRMSPRHQMPPLSEDQLRAMIRRRMRRT